MTSRFPKSRRLTRRSEFLAIQGTGGAAYSRRFVVAMGEGLGRVGITVSKKVGNAVIRNRIKRLVREFVRARPDWVPSQRDVVVIAKRSAAGATLAQVESDLESVRGRLHR